MAKKKNQATMLRTLFIDAITNPAIALIIGWLLLLTFLAFKKEITKKHEK